MKIDIGQTIRNLRLARKMTQPELADLIGVDKGNISRYETGKQGIEFSKLPILAEIFGLKPSELLALAEGSNIEDGPELKGSVPLVSWVQAGDWQLIPDLNVSDIIERIKTTYRARRYTYALRIRGDSMLDKFPDGGIIIVEPEEPIFNKAFVIVRQNGNEATFKQYIEDGSEKFLKPLNPRYPIMPLAQDAVFCGVVKRLEMDV